MPPDHLPSRELVEGWPEFSPEHPLRILVSGCLTGMGCGVDGSSYGAPYPHTERLFRLPNVRVVPFCPEDWAFGTPRENPDIHGGNGFDVLDGRARVLSASGRDWTDAMVSAAHAMLQHATTERVDLALLMDISAACGTQVIYSGNRTEGVYQRGAGVCAALLIRHGIPVLSQRDFRSLALVLQRVDPRGVPPEPGRDHHESEWYLNTFGR
jgi:uncharacterized protein YbbK (DUF523 family)